MSSVGTELSLDDLLNDSLILLVMESDGLTRGDVRDVIRGMQGQFREHARWTIERFKTEPRLFFIT